MRRPSSPSKAIDRGPDAAPPEEDEVPENASRSLANFVRPRHQTRRFPTVSSDRAVLDPSKPPLVPHPCGVGRATGQARVGRHSAYGGQLSRVILQVHRDRSKAKQGSRIDLSKLLIGTHALPTTLKFSTQLLCQRILCPDSLESLSRQITGFVSQWMIHIPHETGVCNAHETSCY
jgi:hypothetical protein